MATNANTLLDLAKNNQIKPDETQFDESKGVAGRVASLTSSASPLMQTARTRAAQNSASRGLLNSTLGAQAGEQAVIETATPIANADAGLFQQQSLANQAARNSANTQNANNTLTAGIQGAQLDVSQEQSNKGLMEQARQFDTGLTQRQSEFGVTSGQTQQQIDAQKAQAAAALAQQQAQLAEQGRQFDTSRSDNLAMFDRELSQKAEQFGLTQQQTMALAQMDVDTKLKMADLEAKYKNEIQSSANISNAWGTVMQGISAIQTDPNLDEATKKVLIENNLASFGAFSNFWKKATGGAVDVSDLLNFGVAQAPGTGGQVNTGPISAGGGGYLGDYPRNPDGTYDMTGGGGA